MSWRSHDDMSCERTRLARRIVDIKTHVVEAAITHITHDAHHGAPDERRLVSVHRGKREAPADRILPGPEPARRALADQRDSRAECMIVAAEQPSLLQRDLHRAEVSWRSGSIVEMRVSPGR